MGGLIDENTTIRSVYCPHCGTEREVQITIPRQGEKTTTRSAYCPHCDDDRDIRITVPWQADICTSCGQNIGDGVN